MPQDKVKEVYDLISELGYFEDENEFRNYVSDPKKRKEAFSLISDAGYFEDENEFNSYFESEKKKPSGELFSQDFPTFRQGVGQSVKPSSQSPLKSQSTTTTTPLPKTTKQAPKDSLGTYNPTGRVRLYNEAKNNIQNRIPQLVEQFNQAQAAGDEQAMQEIEAMINADTQKLDFFDKAVQGQKQLAATQQPDNIGNTMATALEMAGGYLASGVNFIDEAINQSISDAIGFKLSDKALKEINELNSKAPVKRPSDIIAKAGREMLETANKASEERRMNMPYSGGVYEALKSGDFKNAVSNAGYAFTTSLPTSLLMANPITGGLSAAGMAQESVEEARAEKGSVNTDDYIVGALKASTEYVFENMLGTGRQLKELVAKLGKEGAVEATEQVLRAGLKDYFKKLGVNIAEESVGEGLTQITQNAIDKSTGKEVGLFDNVADAALIGLFGGATQGTLTTTISHYIDRAKLKEAEAAKAKAAELAEQALNAPSQVVADAIEREAEKLNDWADEIIEWNNEIGANADPEIIAEIESNNDKIDELEATIAESTPEIAEILTIQLQEIETENAELIKTAEQIALERLESILNEKDSKKNNEEPLSKGVSGLRTESESGQESPELRPEQEEVSTQLADKKYPANKLKDNNLAESGTEQVKESLQGVIGENVIPETNEVILDLNNRLKKAELERTNFLISGNKSISVDEKLKNEISSLKNDIKKESEKLAELRKSNLEKMIDNGQLKSAIDNDLITAEDARLEAIGNGVKIPNWLQDIVDKNKLEKESSTESIFYRTTDFLGEEKEAFMIPKTDKSVIRNQEDVDYFKSNVKRAIDNGKFEQAVKDGRMTLKDAKSIAESYGLKLPKSLLKTNEPTIIESDTPKGDTRVEVTEPIIQTSEGQVEVEKGKEVLKDKEGKPLTLFHGTNKNFKDFDSKKIPQASRYGKGFSFTDGKGIAVRYSLERQGLEDSAENDNKAIVKEVNLSIKTPFDERGKIDKNTPQAKKLIKILTERFGLEEGLVNNILDNKIPSRDSAFQNISKFIFDKDKDEKNFMFKGDTEKTRKVLEEAGYDSIIGEYEDATEYFVFDNKNILSTEQTPTTKEQTSETPKPLEIKEEVPAKEQGVEIKEQTEWDSDEGKKKIEGEITISGKDYYTISIDGEKSNQLILKSELDKEIQLDKSKFDSKTKFDKIRLENESKEKLDAEELKNLNGFGSDLTPMQLGKVVKDLNKKESYNGVIKTRKKAIEDFVKEGRTVETLKNGKRVLQKKDGTFLDSLTKIELDYAEFLIAQTENKVEPTAEKTLDAKNDPNKVVEKTLEEEMADFDFNSLGSESSESVSVQETIDNEREEAYKKSRFDKKWAATYKEAKEKVIKQYQDAKAQKEKAEAKQVKDAGKKNVFVGDEVSGSSVSVNYINQKRRDNAIKNAQEDMNRAIDDLKSLGLTQEEIDSELSPKTIAASESVIEESSSPTKSPKKQVRKKVVAMVQDKTPSKTITEWKKESLDLIDKVVNILLDNYSQNKDARNKVIEQITPLSDIVDADALRLLNEAGVQILKDRFLIIPTPKGQISASLGGLLTTRKEIAKLSDSKVVSNENTRIKNKQAAKADVSDFYEPESKADAKDELDISTTVLENAKNSGNKKLIELAQIQHDFYKDWYNNFDSKQKDKLEEIAREERSLAAIKKREFIQGSKELKDLYNNSYELAREAGIYEIEEFYDFLQVIGVDKIPSKLTNEIAENLFAKAAIDSGAHSFLTYQVRIKNRKQAVTKVTARTSWKMQQKARQVEEMNKNIDRMLDLSSKYETGATKIFKELYQEESKTDRAIRFLEAAKIRAKGKALGVLPPLAIPIGLYNLSLQTMVIALKGGRVVNKAIKEAYAIVKDYISEADYRKHLLELGVISDEFLEVPAEAETAQPESVVTKTSKHFKTITNNKSLNELTKDLKEEDFQYQEVSRQSNTDAAIEYVTENGVEVSLNNFKGSKGLIEGLTTAQRVAVGQVLYRALNSAKKEALKNNDMEQANYIQNEMAQVTSVLQKFGTSLGQGVSQFAEFMLDFSDPVTAAFNMQKHVEAVNAKQRDSGAVKKNSENIAKDINNTVKNGKKKVVKEVVKTVNEELYGLITLGKKGLTDTQKQKVKSIFNTFKVDPNGSSLQAKILPIKEVVAMVVTPKVYNDFIDKVGELVAEGVSLSVAMTRVSAEFIKDKIASPQAMEVVRKRLSEQVKGLKETKPLTEKQKEAKAAREELKEATKEYETLVNELVSEYLQLSPDQKTNNKKLIEMVMDKLGVDERSAKVIATKIAEGVAKNIKKKLENKFANQLSAEERAAKAKGIKPKENPIDEIIAASDTGIAPELVQEYFKNKYGIEELSVQDIQTIQEIAKKIAAAPTENRRGVLLGQIQRAIDSKRQKTLSELFQNLWYARVLSPVLLQIPIGTGDTNITYNLITLLNQTKVYPLTSIFNLITNLKKTIASEKPRTKGELLATITGSLQEAILGAFNAIGQNVIYNEAEQNKIKKFLSVLTNSRYLSQSISYYRTAITDGLDYKKEHDNPFKATAGGKFDISDWLNTLKKAENGDKSAQNKVALAVRAIINGYVNGVTNTLGGQDLFFGSIVGNLYKPALLREKFFEEGFRGKELNAKVFESIVNTKLEYENARQKAIQYRLEQDITIEPKVNMRTNELTYEVKDNGKLKETFDNKEDAETYAREKLAPKGNNFRNDVNYLLNQKIGDIVNKQSERISRNLLLSGDVEGGTRYINNFLQAFQDLFAKWSETLNDKALANNLYDALDIKNMALNLDLKTFEAIYKKAKAIIFKALSIPIKALENLLAFKRVGLNAVRMASNFITPLGLLRYSASFYSKGENSMGLTGQMSYKMTDTERNQILSMAIIGGLTFQFGAIVKKAIQDALKGDDEEEKKELTKEKENSQRLFKEWYKKTTGEEITKEINAFYSQLTEGQVIGSLSWMTDDRKRFYERTGLIIEYSVFEGFNEQGKPIYSTVKNRPDQAMNISVATYQLIDAFGDEEDKDNILLYSAMTPLYSWKDMSIGQGGISILFSRPSPQRLFEKVAQIAVLDNFEVLNPRLIPVTLGYFDQKMRKTPTLFESIKNEATIYGGVKDWMFMRVAPAYAGYNQAMKATQIYGMFGEELYRIPNESQGMISNMISEYFKSDKNMEEQKMQMWLDINGYNKKIWTPNKDEPILIDDKVKELTYEQLNKYGRIGGKKTLEELKSKLKDLQELRQIGEEDASTEEQRIRNFTSQIDEIFKKNFQNAYFEGEKTFGADTKKFLEGKQKLFDESFALKVEKVKDKSDIISEVDKTLIVTEEEQKDRAMNKSIDQYLSEMKDLSNREKIKKLDRLFDIRSISQNEYDYAYDLIKNK